MPAKTNVFPSRTEADAGAVPTALFEMIRLRNSFHLRSSSLCPGFRPRTEMCDRSIPCIVSLEVLQSSLVILARLSCTTDAQFAYLIVFLPAKICNGSTVILFSRYD